MKILIFGVSGKIGHTIFTELKKNKNLQVFGTARSNTILRTLSREYSPDIYTPYDITTLNAVGELIQQIKPELVINAIGIVKQLPASRRLPQAFYANSLWPHQLAKLASQYRARIIQLSSDCVYSGNRGFYSEEAIPDPVDLYGQTKLLGELYYPNTITLRTSTIGHEISTHNGLIEWFLSQQGEVSGYTDAIYSGLPTVELARVLDKFVIPNLSKLTGVYHLGSAPISKYDLLTLVAKRYNKDIAITKYSDLHIDRSLNAKKFQSATGYQAPSWTNLVKQMYIHYQKSPWYNHEKNL